MNKKNGRALVAQIGCCTTWMKCRKIQSPLSNGSPGWILAELGRQFRHLRSKHDMFWLISSQEQGGNKNYDYPATSQVRIMPSRRLSAKHCLLSTSVPSPHLPSVHRYVYSCCNTVRFRYSSIHIGLLRNRSGYCRQAVMILPECWDTRACPLLAGFGLTGEVCIDYV